MRSVNDEPQAHVREFRRNLRLLERQIERALSSQTGCCGVTVAQCHLLLELDQSGPTGVGDCARILDLDASTLSRTVDGLVRAGLASRETDMANRRRQVVALTPAGGDKVDSIHEICDRYYADVLESLPADSRQTVVDGIATLAVALRAKPFDGCCAGTSDRGASADCRQEAGS